MSEEKQLAGEEGGKSFAPLEEEQGQDFTVPIVLFFGGSVPLVALTQALGLGMPGFVVGAVAAGILAATGGSWFRRIPGLFPGLERYTHLDWTVLLKPLDDEGNVVDADPVVEQGQPKDEPRGEHLPGDAVPVEQVQRLFPMYSEAETLRLGRVAATGQRFDPHFNQLLGQGLVIAAVQGSGKSIINGVIIERSGRAGLPVVVLDHKGEYDTVTELPFLNGFRAGAGDGYDFQLTEKNTDAFVRLVMEKRSQAIVNLPSYGDSWVARAKIVAAVGKALMNYAALLRRSRQMILPCLVIVDEAQLYFPQNVQLLPAEARNNQDVLNDLSNAYFALVSNGRSNGYTMCFATQSLTFIAKWAIKSCQVKIFMRHAEKNDLDECERTFSPHVTRMQFETFPAGTGVVAGLTPLPMVVKFDMKRSRDVSETPMMDRLRAPRQAPPAIHLPAAAQPARLDIPAPQENDLEAERMTATIARHMSIEQLLAFASQMPDIDADDSRYEGAQSGGFAEVPDNGTQVHSEHNVTVFPGRGNLPSEPPDIDADEPVVSVEGTSEDFQPGPNDLLLSEVQAEVLIAYYRACNSIDKSLAQIRNEKGQGLSGRYFRHASHILEQRGLKKVKRA